MRFPIRALLSGFTFHVSCIPSYNLLGERSAGFHPPARGLCNRRGKQGGFSLGQGRDGRGSMRLSAAALAAAGNADDGVEPDFEELTRLLDEGGDVNERSGSSDGEGLTLLQHAASAGHLGAVRLLLQRGADVNLTSQSIYLSGSVEEVNAVQCSAEQLSRCRGGVEEQGHLACLRELLNAGGELRKKNEHVGHAAGMINPVNPI